MDPSLLVGMVRCRSGSCARATRGSLQHELLANRAWLRPWEATSPDGPVSFDMRLGIRRLLQQYRDGAGVPFVMEYDGEVAGQLNVWGDRARLARVGDDRLLGERAHSPVAGITPTAVAMATDICFAELRLHRMEICIRPENRRACASSRSSASATRDCVAASSTSTATGATTTLRPGPRGGARGGARALGRGACAAGCRDDPAADRLHA